MIRRAAALLAGLGLGAIALAPARPAGPPGGASSLLAEPASPGVARFVRVGAPIHAEAPPPGHTGGFGEPTCLACHNAYPLNEPGGRLTLEGLPEAFQAGEEYALTVVLTVPETALAGFQVAARLPDGGQAGTWGALDARVAVADSAGISYPHSTRAGAEPDGADRASWSLSWTAPDVDEPVRFHLAANSANGDNSPFGDLVYATEVQVGSAR